MKLSLTTDASRAQALLSRAPERVRVALRGAVEDGSTYVLARVKKYPTQRAGSTYTRTHTLERSWSRRLEFRGANVEARIGSSGNIAPYNRQVMDRDRQARQHRGRWTTAQAIAEQARPRVQRMFENRLQAAGLDR